MNLGLKAYREVIQLDTPYFPNKRTTDQEELLTLLMEELDMANRRALELEIRKGRSNRELIKALLTVRPSGHVSDHLMSLVDGMLQEEFKTKKITDSQHLSTVESSYPASDKISVWNGDITTLEIDAIVNAANPQMEGCFIPFHNCIDNVIHNASGVQLREDCGTIMGLQGNQEETGVAKITRGYNLPSKYVIHTVGPIVSGGFLLEEHKADLKKTYEACLELAKESGLVKSIAFCSISTGVYGFPFEPAAEIALKTVSEWLERNPGAIDHVVFNTFGDEATAIYERLIQEWRKK